MIIIKSQEQIERIRAASQAVALAHRNVREQIRPGMSTYQVDNIVRHTLRKHKATSPFYRYQFSGKTPFPGHSCISINEEIVHGIPRHNRRLKEGDVVKVDVGATLNDAIGDAAATIIVGSGISEVVDIVDITKEALYKAIEMSVEDAWLYDISDEIYSIATQHGYGVILDYGGHGVGLSLHEAPFIPNCRPEAGKGINVKLKPGMTLAFEPMFTLGESKTEELDDGWTVITKDRSISTHWEHTILINGGGEGADILTKETS